jgi:SAM-dependent methyltransferase
MTSGLRAVDIEAMFEKVVALPDGKSETKRRVRWLRDTLEDLRGSGLLPAAEGRQRFVDIGGANGIFAYEFQNANWQAHIVDPSAQGTFIERKAGIPYAQAFYRAGLFDHGFDLITLIYILEHCENPLALLQEARADLEPGGALFVEVPDALAFHRRPPENDIFNSAHLWMFDPISMSRLFEQAGFEILSFHRLLLIRGHFVLMALARAR